MPINPMCIRGIPSFLKHKSMSYVSKALLMRLVFHVYDSSTTKYLPIRNSTLLLLFHACDSNDCVLIFLLEILPCIFLLSDSIGTVVRVVVSKPDCIGLFVHALIVFSFVLHVHPFSPSFLGQFVRLDHTM
jgi:hypothetical protein